MWVQFDVHNQRIGKDETKQSQRHNLNSRDETVLAFIGGNSMQEVLLNGRLGEAAALLACVTALSPKSASSQYSRCLCVTKVTAVATGTCVCHQCHNITGGARVTMPKSL